MNKRPSHNNTFTMIGSLPLRVLLLLFCILAMYRSNNSRLNYGYGYTNAPSNQPRDAIPHAAPPSAQINHNAPPPPQSLRRPHLYLPGYHPPPFQWHPTWWATTTVPELLFGTRSIFQFQCLQPQEMTRTGFYHSSPHKYGMLHLQCLQPKGSMSCPSFLPATGPTSVEPGRLRALQCSSKALEGRP
jgi:hypothetical protein